MEWFSQIGLSQVFFYSFLTAVATGLGAIPFFFVRRIPKHFMGYANAAAAGLMLAASFQLIYEGISIGVWRTILGTILGLLLVTISHKILTRSLPSYIGEVRKADIVQMALIMGIMTAHSFAEGIGVGVAYGETISFGLFITIAIAVHNIPEGIAISLILVPRGMSVWRAMLWNIFSSLPQPLMAVIAFAFVRVFSPILPVGLGFASGAMLWMVHGEILPESLSHTTKERVAIVLTLSAVAMMLFQNLLES